MNNQQIFREMIEDHYQLNKRRIETLEKELRRFTKASSRAPHKIEDCNQLTASEVNRWMGGCPSTWPNLVDDAEGKN